MFMEYCRLKYYYANMPNEYSVIFTTLKINIFLEEIYIVVVRCGYSMWILVGTVSQ